MRLRILVLSPIEPFPPHGGWQTVIYNDITHLALLGHEIKVLATTYRKNFLSTGLEGVAEVDYFNIHNSSRIIQVAKNLVYRTPFTVKRHMHPELIGVLKSIIADGLVDVVLIEDVVMAHYAQHIKRQNPGIGIYLRGHNINSIVCKRYYESQSNPIFRLLGYIEYKKWFNYERNVFGICDHVSQITPIDVLEAQKMNPAIKCELVYSGVDLNYFRLNECKREENLIIHVGSLTAYTKLPAMEWFIEQVLPIVKKIIPRIKLELAGAVPDEFKNKYSSDSIHIYGKVDDARPYLQRGSVFIAPQFVGSGIRIKILNAMATGNAVVSSPVACEGLPVKNGEHLIIAGDKQCFADSICTLLNDPVKRDEMGYRARKLVEDQFSWLKIAKKIEAGFSSIVKTEGQ